MPKKEKTKEEKRIMQKSQSLFNKHKLTPFSYYHVTVTLYPDNVEHDAILYTTKNDQTKVILFNGTYDGGCMHLHLGDIETLDVYALIFIVHTPPQNARYNTVKTVPLYLEPQSYKNIELQLVDDGYAGRKAFKYMIHDSKKSVWIPKKHTHENGRIKDKMNLDYLFPELKQK